MRTILFCLCALISINITAQTELKDLSSQVPAGNGLRIGGYGQVDYNQSLSNGIHDNGVLDVHRFVLLFTYRFNDRISLVSEIEMEHVSEVFVEQAYLQYRINDFINLRSGLLLIPMGIINQYHEPVTFNGVERPITDHIIVPSTWRELGFGIQGSIITASLSYQVYLVNGFKSYDEKARLNGESGLRGGRQKGAESFISTPNLTGRIEYFGIPGLNMGVSGFIGKTESQLYQGISKSDHTAVSIADSSVIGVSMLGMDARFNKKGWQARGQFYLADLSNTLQYNTFTAGAAMNDLGKGMIGYYLEMGYDLFHSRPDVISSLIPFIRYEVFDTHYRVDEGLMKNASYHQNHITCGIGWKPAPGAVLKADLQFRSKASENTFVKTLNAGIGFMF